jgi:hypothetical protein
LIRIYEEVGQRGRIGWYIFAALTLNRSTNKGSQRSSVASFLILFVLLIFLTWGRYSILGIATRYRLQVSVFASQWATPAPGPTQPPAQMYQGFFQGVNRPVSVFDHPRHLKPNLRMDRTILLIPLCLHGLLGGDLFSNFKSAALYSVRVMCNERMVVNNELERTQWKWSWPNLRYCPGISLETLRKARKYIWQDSWFSVRDWIPTPSKYKFNALLLEAAILG